MSTGPVKKTISYFVGAGAECAYGLPDGGKFALDLFRYDSSKDKESFRKKEMLLTAEAHMPTNGFPGITVRNQLQRLASPVMNS